MLRIPLQRARGVGSPWTPWRVGLVLFLLACAVRLALLFTHMVPREWLLPDTFSELGRTALTLAESGRYADAYVLPTGPTAHPAPIWTGIVALLYRTFGFSRAAGVARAVLGIGSFAAVAALLPWVAQRTGLGWRAGTLAGLAAALVPWLGASEVAGWSAYEPLAVAGVFLALLALAGATRAWSRLAAPGRAALLLPLAGYPLVHYVVTYMPSYAYPVHGLLLLFAAAVFVPPGDRAVTPDGGRGLGGGRSRR